MLRQYVLTRRHKLYLSSVEDPISPKPRARFPHDLRLKKALSILIMQFYSFSRVIRSSVNDLIGVDTRIEIRSSIQHILNWLKV